MWIKFGTYLFSILVLKWINSAVCVRGYVYIPGLCWQTATRSFRGSRDLARREKKIKEAVQQAARTEMLLQEEVGYVRANTSLGVIM